MNIQRIDVVRDCYFRNTLKSETRNNQSAGVRTKVLSNGKIPNKWATFFRCSDNKSELFLFSSAQIISRAPNDNTVVAANNFKSF